MENQIFTIENGVQTWDLEACTSPGQLAFFNNLLDFAAENNDQITQERDGALLVSDYINPPLSYGFAQY